MADLSEAKNEYTRPELSSGDPGRLSSGVWGGVPVGERLRDPG